MDTEFAPPFVPFPLRWEVAPASWEADDTSLVATAPPATDLFTDPAGDAAFAGAPRAQGTLPGGDFSFSARITVDFAGTYDAGALLLWASPTVWAKLCFEFSPQREAMVVSVITRDVSDDANSAVIEGSTVWLRVSRRGAAYAFHSSTDGRVWTFVRHFGLTSAPPMQAGLLVQSPLGSGCTVRFDDISFTATTPTDLRDGS